MTANGSPLGSSSEVPLTSDAILIIGKLVTGRAHDFRQHHPDIGFQAIFPIRMSIGDKIDKSLANTPEVARRVVDRVIDQRVVRTLVWRRFAIEFALAICFETESDFPEVGINQRIVKLKSIAREIAGLCGDHPQDTPAVSRYPRRRKSRIQRHFRKPFTSGWTVNSDL